jgi:tripartite-type tricarboxylate transporter receptor subunit TctC
VNHREDVMRLLHSLLLVLVSLTVAVQQAPVAQAQGYPTRPITLISPWPAGGASDTLCRMLGARLADRLGKPVLIENRPGAGSTIGVAAAARAAPDGYTLAWAGGAALAISVSVYKKLPYDPTKDFAPVALVTRIPFVLVVHPSLPARSVPELIKLAKEKPGQLSYASGGVGSPHHLYAELFKSMTGIQMMHVPYKGSAPAVADVVAGHVPVLFSDAVVALPLIREGKLWALGVTEIARLASAPEIPTIAEAGVPDFDAVGWSMIVAPANTPEAIVTRLHAELKSIVELPDFQQQMLKLGMIPVSSPSPEELRHVISSEIARWSKVVHQAGIAGSE